MMKRIVVFCCLVLVSLMIQAEPTLHRFVSSVQLSPEYIVVTEIRDISPGGATECSIPVEGKYMMKKFMMNVMIYGEENYFERLSVWNPSAPASEKQRKCGRLWVDAYNAKMCFGLQPTRQKYFATYPMVNVLYTDNNHDVLDFDFLNLDEKLPAQKAEIRINIKDVRITEENFNLKESTADGNIKLEDGVIIITPKEDSNPVTNMHIHLLFRQGLFPGIPAKEDTSPVKAAVSPVKAVSLKSSNSGSGLTHYKMTQDELHSPMMGEACAKKEGGNSALLELFYSYPKTFVFVGCLLYTAFFIAYRKIKARML